MKNQTDKGIPLIGKSRPRFRPNQVEPGRPAPTPSMIRIRKALVAMYIFAGAAAAIAAIPLIIPVAESLVAAAIGALIMSVNLHASAHVKFRDMLRFDSEHPNNMPMIIATAVLCFLIAFVVGYVDDSGDLDHALTRRYEIGKVIRSRIIDFMLPL